jgi:hypothetical protein
MMCTGGRKVFLAKDVLHSMSVASHAEELDGQQPK